MTVAETREMVLDKELANALKQRELLKNIVADLLLLVDNGDFSNGNKFQGKDEGEVMCERYVNSLLEALKDIGFVWNKYENKWD